PYDIITLSAIQTGTFSLLAGLIAYAPVNTPVFSLETSERSMSDLFFTSSLYCFTASCCSLITIFSTNGCSGASTQYVERNSVSVLVVHPLQFTFLSASS